MRGDGRGREGREWEATDYAQNYEFATTPIMDNYDVKEAHSYGFECQ